MLSTCVMAEIQTPFVDLDAFGDNETAKQEYIDRMVSQGLMNEDGSLTEDGEIIKSEIEEAIEVYNDEADEAYKNGIDPETFDDSWEYNGYSDVTLAYIESLESSSTDTSEENASSSTDIDTSDSEEMSTITDDTTDDSAESADTADDEEYTTTQPEASGEVKETRYDEEEAENINETSESASVIGTVFKILPYVLLLVGLLIAAYVFLKRQT